MAHIGALLSSLLAKTLPFVFIMLTPTPAFLSRRHGLVASSIRPLNTAYVQLTYSRAGR
jgi:hypothetical protein